MPNPVIVDAIRTPIGALGGVLSAVRPDDLAALVLKAILERNCLDPALIEEVYLGCANQAGEDNRNVARMALLLAGFPVQVAGVTFNRLCASGLTAVNQAARAIRAGEGEIFIAGGVESMSRAPYSLPKAETGLRLWQPHRLRHRPRLALSQPENGGAVRHRGDGRDRREHRRTHARASPASCRMPSPPRATPGPSPPSTAGKFAEEILPVPHPPAQGRPAGGDHRRTPAPRHHRRIAGPPAPRLPQERHGHRRQLLRAERRRGRPAADERRKSAGIGAETPGAHRSPLPPPVSRRASWAWARSPRCTRPLQRAGLIAVRYRPGRAERSLRRPVAGGDRTSWASPSRSPTSTAAPSPWVTRWAAPAPASSPPCCTR